MKTYRMEMMNDKDYANYMGGGYDYTVIYYLVEAENAEEAIAKTEANFPEMMVNKTYVRTVEELEAEEKARNERIEARRKAEEARIAKMKATKAAKKAAGKN